MSIITQCNLCGKLFDVFDDQHDFKIVRRLGYGSIHDGEDIELDLCCGCMDELIEKCEISPLITVEKCEWIGENGRRTPRIQQYLNKLLRKAKEECND